MNNEKKDFLKKLLNVTDLMESSPFRFSCFSMALKAARENSGRNLLTGRYEGNEISCEVVTNGLYESKMFTATIMYLIILDQLGTIFKKGVFSKDESGIKVALKSFSSIKTEKGKISAFKTLRNSLAHNFGLCSKEHKNDKDFYKFALLYSRDDKLIELGEKTHDFASKQDKFYTSIGVHSFCELVEETIANLKAEIENGTAELIIEDIQEIKARFTVI
ncbi:MAG: hypothetical protein ABJA35_10930 [Parafilimonas sp.]